MGGGYRQERGEHTVILLESNDLRLIKHSFYKEYADFWLISKMKDILV